MVSSVMGVSSALAFRLPALITTPRTSGSRGTVTRQLAKPVYSGSKRSPYRRLRSGEPIPSKPTTRSQRPELPSERVTSTPSPSSASSVMVVPKRIFAPASAAARPSTFASAGRGMPLFEGASAIRGCGILARVA